MEIELRIDYTAKVVKESLAAFFELYYCRNNHIFTDLELDWSTNSVGIYPYSGAKYLLPLNHNATPLFIDVLRTSYFDFDQALRTLLETNMDDFYLVKNHKEVKTVVVNKPKKSSGIVNITLPIDNSQIQEWLKKMGNGWFILKYAEDQGMPSPIPLNYGKPDAYATRKFVYRQTKLYHRDIIRFLKRKKLYFMVHA